MLGKLFLLVLGIGLFTNGAYDLYIEAGRAKPERTVTLSELVRTQASFGRNVHVTGATADNQGAVVFYKTKFGQKEEGSEEYYIPLVEPSLLGSRLPSALLLIRQEKMAGLMQTHRLNPHDIHGVVLTRWDLEDKARDLLAQRFGAGAVDAMVVVEYERAKGNPALGFLKVFGGLVLFVFALASLRRK